MNNIEDLETNRQIVMEHGQYPEVRFKKIRRVITYNF